MKKIIVIIISFLLFISCVNASQTGENSIGFERTESNNYGVNKKWNINDKNLSNVLRTPYVDANTKIYDFANALSDDEKSELNDVISGFISETGLDFVFVSINMPYVNDDENYNYAYDFYDYNDFGISNDKYGGFIFLLNTYEENKIYISSVFGEAQLYCMEEDLDKLLDSVFFDFRDRRYKDGVISFIHGAKREYSAGYDENKYYIDENGSLQEKYTLPYATSIISGAVVSLLSTLGLVKKNKMVKKASDANSYLIKSSIEYLNKTDNFINTVTTHHVITSSSSSGSGGHSHSGFGSSGGGHISGGRHF